MKNYIVYFNESGLTYTDIAHELGCCELTARNKITGKTRITKAEALVLDKIFGVEEVKNVRSSNTVDGI